MEKAEKMVDEVWEIVFEAETARSWVIALLQRSERCSEKIDELLPSEEVPGWLKKDLREEMKDLKKAKTALLKAASALRMFEGAVRRREC
jgi:hypothetical protein